MMTHKQKGSHIQQVMVISWWWDSKIKCLKRALFYICMRQPWKPLTNLYTKYIVYNKHIHCSKMLPRFFLPGSFAVSLFLKKTWLIPVQQRNSWVSSIGFFICAECKVGFYAGFFYYSSLMRLTDMWICFFFHYEKYHPKSLQYFWIPSLVYEK